MNFLSLIFGLFVIVFPLAFLLKLYRSTYFRPVSVVLVKNNGSEVMSIKPTRTWFRNQSRGLPYGFVHLSSSFYAFYVNDPSESLRIQLVNAELPSPIYVFQKGRFGKFVSVDLSDRCLNDLISKISKE